MAVRVQKVNKIKGEAIRTALLRKHTLMLIATLLSFRLAGETNYLNQFVITSYINIIISYQ